MKKIGWIIAVFVLFFVGDRIGGFMLSKVVEKSEFRYSRLYTGRAAADILLVGNSRGLTFFEPAIEEKTGWKTFNISYNGMTMPLGEALVKDYLDTYPAPKLMLLEVTMADRLDEAIINNYSFYVPYSERMQNLIKSNSEKVYIGGELSHLYRYNSEVFQRSLFYLRKSDKDWLLDGIMNDKMIASVNQAEIDSTLVLAPAFDALKNTVAYAQSKGVKVKLVVNPYYPPFARQMPNLDSYIAKVEETTGLEVHDFSQAIERADAFGDYRHTNVSGAIELVDIFIKKGILPVQ